MKMLDVGMKRRSRRVAIAVGRVRMSTDALALVRRGEVEKGNVIAAARLAGVMGAKRAPELIPLCHPIVLSSVVVEIEPLVVGVDVRATVSTVERTGVEMEALTAVMAACLTVYDMLKSVDPGMAIENVQLVHKSGGRSGVWTRSEVATSKMRAKRRAPASPAREASDERDDAPARPRRVARRGQGSRGRS